MDEYDKAKKLLEHLLELYRLKEKILLMDDSVMSEIKNYTKPPQLVHSVMSAVFLVLGETTQTISVSLNVKKFMNLTLRRIDIYKNCFICSFGVL